MLAECASPAGPRGLGCLAGAPPTPPPPALSVPREHDHEAGGVILILLSRDRRSVYPVSEGQTRAGAGSFPLTLNTV